MARRHWTLMLVSDGSARVRRLRLSRDVVRGLVGAVLLLVAVVSSAATRAVDDGDTFRELAVVRKNALLEAEVSQLRAQVDTLRASVETLASKDAYYRLLAGLEPLDDGTADVHPVSLTARPESRALYELDRGLARHIVATSSDLSTLLRRARLLSFSWREAEDTLIGKHDRLASTPSIAPTEGPVSSDFSYRRWHPLLGQPRPHLGVDMVAPRGTPIVSAAKGRVTFVGDQGEYGLTVEIDHGYGYVTRYAHASRILVRLGQPVERGDMIALVGQTGLAMGPHLHYEVIVNGRHVDPRRFITSARVVAD